MRIYFYFLFLLSLALPCGAQIVINEVDADSPDTDIAEFLELYGPANQSLDGMVLVFFNGNGDISYAAFDLDGHSLNADGFFVLCGNAANVPNCDLDVSPDSNLIQNGADAVALFTGDATDFPNGTAITTTNLIDALVYDTDDSDDSGLLALIPGQPQINENGNGNKDTESNSRIPDGGAALQTTTYTQKTPTPGASNVGGATSTEVINEFVANHTGTDLFEYIEFSGDPNRDYSSLSIIQIEGDALDGPGTIASIHPVGTTDDQGIWYTGFLENQLGGGSKTFALVGGFSGSLGDDLDTDDDGTLDVEPWSQWLDDIATDDGEVGAQTYATTVLTDGYDGQAFSPGGASRIPNGTDTNTTSDWTRNSFSGSGLPGFPGTLNSWEALNTPGYPNTTLKPPVINEFVLDHQGTDDHEFLEVFGDAATDYSAYWLLVIGGDAGSIGVVSHAVQIGTSNLSGTWTESFVDSLPNGTLSLFLVNSFSGSVLDDLDTDDDGTLDAKPWTVVVDEVAVFDGDAGDVTYGSLQLADGFDAQSGHPRGASRIPNGMDTNQSSDWMRNDFDGEGLPGMSGSLVAGEALNTPDAFNSQHAQAGTDIVLNEWVANHTGLDDHEFVEVFGSPDSNYSHCWLLAIDGDALGNPGQIERVVQIGETDSNGFWWSGFLTEQFENTSLTWLLVEAFSGSASQDLDTNNDGTLDVTPWTQIIDSLSVDNNQTGDLMYSTVVLTPSYDGGIFTVAGASRLPNGVDNDQVTDWTRNDFHGKGLPGFTGFIDPGEAFNTPGTFNTDSGTGAKLTEFVFSHSGGDTHEFVEIHGDAGLSYTSTSILIVEGDLEENPGQIDEVIACGSTNGGGFWVSDYFTDTLENGSQTILVVENFSGALGDDLDINNDGILDSEPWNVISDDLAVDDGDTGDFTYSTSVLSPASSGFDAIGGASRFPYGLDTDSHTDWVINDEAGEGLPGFATGSVEADEAFNTPGRVTQIFLNDYYSPVQTGSALQLRMSLHEVIRDHIRFNYTADTTDTWDILEDADEDPLNSSNVLDLYRNRSFTKEGGGNDFYNREHTWPKSYGFPDDYLESSAHTDCHHLMISDSGYNSTRSNLPYGECSASCSEAETDAYNGQGGGTGVYPGNSNWYSGSGNTGTFEVWIDRRGDVARALLYLDVRYEGGNHSFTGFSEPDLILTDNTSLIQTHNSNTDGSAYMGRLTTLLQWHLDDPVDDMERRRNAVVASYQGNRNPFVDNPEWVDCVFMGICDAPCYLELFDDWRSAPSTCLTGETTVLDYIMVIDGTCSCW